MTKQFNPFTTDLAVSLMRSPEEATLMGMNADEAYRDSTVVRIERVVIVQKGTEGGEATMDIQMVDAEGKKYVAFVTAALLAGVVRASGVKNA